MCVCKCVCAVTYAVQVHLCIFSLNAICRHCFHNNLKVDLFFPFHCMLLVNIYEQLCPLPFLTQVIDVLLAIKKSLLCPTLSRVVVKDQLSC